MPALVVAIGGSAGALPAFERLCHNLPENLDAAYLVVQHHKPEFKTLLPELLGRVCRLPVVMITNGMDLRAGRVHVVPAGQQVQILEGVFQLEPVRDEHARLHAIDELLAALAATCRERLVGILVSGAGTDGTTGLHAVRRAGGIAVCQDPREARFDDMPMSAIHAAAVDHVLGCDEVGPFLAATLEDRRERRAAGALGAGGEEGEERRLLREVFATLLQRTGHDFSLYKKTTAARRVQRRQDARGVATLEDYCRLLLTDPAEPQELLRDLLISITRFFRDREAWDALDALVVKPLFERRPASEAIRVWVPACASGEETYSIAILLHEERARRREESRPLQIFATDMDRMALDRARNGRYAGSIAEDLPPDLLGRYFRRVEGGFQVLDEVREMCTFAEHSLIKDPPFSRVDLISCRNLLIYWEAELQEKAAPLFHYALNPEGYLFLGPAESVDGVPDYFRVIDKRNRIFQRTGALVRPLRHFPLTFVPTVTGRIADRVEPLGGVRSERDLTRVITASLFDNHAPPAVVVNDRGAIVFVAGRTGRYLEATTGAITHNLFDLVRRPIRPEVHALVHRAIQQGQVVTHTGLAFQSDGVVREVDVTARPLPEVADELRLFMVVFEERPRRADDGGPVRAEGAAAPSRDSIVEQLEGELRQTREHLQSTVEEVKSSNEELLSMNEELQSANEELQTSKEELQSANEELETVNTELSRKVEELDRANSDLHNFFENTLVPTIFLDAALRVKKYTPAASRVFSLIPADIGRAIADITTHVDGVDLVAAFTEVLRTLRPAERQVTTRGQREHFLLRINPYRTVANVIDGVVVTFADITELKRVEEQQRRLAAIVEGSGDAIVGCGLDGAITTWNQGAEKLYWHSAREAIGHPIALVVPEEDRAHFDELMRQAVGGRPVSAFDGEALRKDGRRVTVSFTLSPFHDSGGAVVGVSSIGRDISDRRRVEEMQQRLAAIVESSQDAIISKDLDGIVTSWNRGAEQLFGYSAAEMIGKPIFRIVPSDHAEDVLGILEIIKRGDRVEHYDTVRVRKDGARVDVSLTVSPIRDANGRIVGASKIARDITARKAADANAERNLRLRDEFISLASHELKTPLTTVKLQNEIVRRRLGKEDPVLFTTEALRRLVNDSERQVERLTRLVDEMLDVSRISTGRLTLHFGRVSLAQVVTETVQSLSHVVASSGCTLTQHLDPDVVGRWDRDRLEQVITNLLTNALKYGSRNPVSIAIRDTGAEAEIVVTDHGIGIARADQARIFERFERVAGEQGGGFGIGLYIVREIVSWHGGTVRVDSEPGHGSTFTVVLPKEGPDHAGD